MISCSDEFKALWHKKIGNVERTRIRYKRRYWTGSAFALEAEWGVLEEDEFIGIGRIAQALDVPFRNVFRISNVTLRFPNLYNEWIESTGSPSFFAADGVATEGYELHRSLFQVQHGYRLADGTWEWLSVFTGVALRARITGRGAEAAVEVAGMAYLLEKADAEQVRDTDVTLEDCVPATGDGSNKDFESTSTGVDRATDLQVNAVSLTKGSGWKTSNENQLAAAGNTGRLAITLDSAPAGGQTVKVSLVRWLRNQLIETLLGLLFDEAGITSAERSIAPIVFPGGVSGSVDVDTEAEWENGSLLAGLDTNIVPGSISKRYYIDHLDSLAAWTIASGSWAVAGNVLTGSGEINIPYAHSEILLYQWTANVGTVTGPFGNPVGETRVVILGSASTPGNGYALRIVCSESALGGPTTEYVLVRYDAGAQTILASTIPGITDNGTHTWRLHRVAGTITVYKDGVAFLSAADSTYSTGSYVTLTATYSTNFSELKHDDTAAKVYESEEFDLLQDPDLWGTLSYAQTLNGGAVAWKTNVAAAPGGPYDGWVAIDGTSHEILSNKKRYLKIQATITPDTAIFPVSPQIDSWLANFTTTTVYVSLANHRGKKCLAQVERYLRTADYELAFRGDGTAIVRAKDTSAEPVIALDQENGIIDVLSYETGVPERLVNVGRVRHGEFVAEYDGAAAGEASPTSEERYGRVVQDDDLSDVALALDVNLAAARARAIYDNNRRSATDPRPHRRLRLKVWLVPWLELGDVVRVAFYDNPYMRQFQAADPLHRVGPYFNLGAPGNVLAKDEDFKVLEYTPDYDTRTAELLVEELSA